MRHLPSGTVTLLFTDIEGSTRLLEEVGDGYADVLAEHRRVLRDAFTRHNGVEVDTQGDAFFVAFARATDAMAAAAEGQAALDGGPVRVRIGIHTGEPTVTGEGYVGLDVHKGARIASSGHGGQVVISEATRQLLDADGDLRDLGEHRLKDLGAPERLYQLGTTEFPALKTLYRTNLPIQATPLVGRERELEEVGALLASNRLLTLLGPGGSGKTRLALQLAAEAQEDFPDGVFWAPLSAVRDPAVVGRAVGAAIGADGDLADFIDGKRLLILMDNFEQIVEAAPMVSVAPRRDAEREGPRDEPRAAACGFGAEVRGRAASGDRCHDPVRRTRAGRRRGVRASARCDGDLSAPRRAPACDRARRGARRHARPGRVARTARGTPPASHAHGRTARRNASGR